MKEYLRILSDVYNSGDLRSNRTGTDTYSKFNVNAEYDISDYKLPLLTTKKIHYPAIIHELIWMLSGSDNIKYLQDSGVRIWNEWADEDGNLNKVYGKQWRHWNDTRIVTSPTEYNYCISQNMSRISWDSQSVIFTREIDQIIQLEDLLNRDPYSRRMIVTAWNVANIDEMALPPCHTLSQFYVRFDEKGNKFLDCTLYQRSGDIFLGIPFNIVFYSLFVHMLCHVHGLKPGKLYHTIGDAHIYVNHIDQVKEQLSRTTIDCIPTVSFSKKYNSILDIKYDDIEILNYTSHPTIKGQVAV
jgi:thymidylate synthase